MEKMEKASFNITGMSCSACSARIERGVSKLAGIGGVGVNLLTNSMSVTFDAEIIDAGQIVKTVEKLGYGASVKFAASPAQKVSTAYVSAQTWRPRGAGADAVGADAVGVDAMGAEAASAADGDAAQTEAAGMKKRLLASVLFTVPLFYISMGGMAGWPLPGFLSGMENAMVYAFTLFLLTLPVIFINRGYFRAGFLNLLRLSPNMDSLIAIGSGAAFVYGVYAVYRIAVGLGHGDAEAVHRFSMDLYFESAAMILTLISLGKFLEARAKGRTSGAITKLLNLTPQTAVVLRGGAEAEIPVGDVVVGDTLIVREGGSVPVDGVVTEGHASVDESAITGESLPADKGPGVKVTGGAVNRSGYIKMEATAVGGDTALAKIIRLVDEATSGKAPIARLADRISGVFVPVVIAVSICAALFWTLAGMGADFALTAAISVLVISCPCALGLATPTAIMVGMGRAASHGILFKSAEALETLHGAGVVALDKTGTVTEGKPEVTDILPNAAGGVSRDELLAFAASIESKSGHPFAAPIVAAAGAATAARAAAAGLTEITDYRQIPGQGVTGTIRNAPAAAETNTIHNAPAAAEVLTALGGNRKLMAAYGIDTSAFGDAETTLSDCGKTALYFARGNKLLGVIAVADTVKPTSAAAVAELTRMGLDVVMLTGDNERTAEAVRRRAGIKRAVAGVLPEDKEKEIRALQASGKKVVMVGDGINDAPALARADVGIAIGAGTDIAIESADVVLMKSEPGDIATAIALGKAVMRNIRQNLFWAFIYNIIGIPVAAGVFYAAFGLTLNPMIAAAAMSFSSVSVVTNALRLNFTRIE